MRDDIVRPSISRRAAVLSLGAFAATRSIGVSQELIKLRVATSPIDVAAQAYYALDQGYFRQAGLDVELINLRPGAVSAAVAGGSADIGAYATIGLFTAREGGVMFSLIAGAGMYSSKFPGAALLVAKDSPIRKAADLNGKTICTESLRSLGPLATYAWADKNGGDYKSFKFVEIASAEEGAAVAAGRVDASSTVEPFVSRAVAEGSVRVLAHHFDAIAPEFCEGGWFAMAEFANAKPDAMKRFAAVMYQASRWANRNPELAGAILQKYSKAPPTPAAYRTIFPERLELSKLQPLIDSATRFGLLNSPHRVADIVPAYLL
jgi:NitT/TauT family transport system substrate-binding protein